MKGRVGGGGETVKIAPDRKKEGNMGGEEGAKRRGVNENRGRERERGEG